MISVCRLTSNGSPKSIADPLILIIRMGGRDNNVRYTGHSCRVQAWSQNIHS